jgi:hypothetical protein
MKAQATALHPFVPAGTDFALALAFFAELGFETAWKQDGLAGLLRRSRQRTSAPGSPACGCGRRRSSRGAARSTSSIPPACAGMFAKRRSAEKKLD